MDIWNALVNLWSSIPSEVKIYILYPLVVALIVWLVTRDKERAKTQKILDQVEATPLMYVGQLGALIEKAVAEGKSKAFVNGRAIVERRDALRASLTSISALLNTEIDTLAAQVGQTQGSIPGSTASPQMFRRGGAPEDAAYATIQVLAKAWPAKAAQIQIAVRKLMAELGLPIKASAPTSSTRYRGFQP